MYTDFVMNTGSGFQGGGAVGEALAGYGYDPGLSRPYFDAKRRACVTVNTGQRDAEGRPIFRKELVGDRMAQGLPVLNATALRKEEWVQMDNIVLKAARQRLRAWSDLAAVSSYGGFDGMSKMFLEHETMSDPGEAMVDLEGVSEGRNDSPLFQLQGLPLPITHVSYYFTRRKLTISRNGNTPLDTAMGEAAARRVAEKIEKTLIGVETGLTYGSAAAGSSGIAYGRTPTVYGYTNFPNRITYSGVTAPTGGGWVAGDTLNQVLAMRDLAYAANFYGPFMLYHSNDWDQYMDNDYILTGGNVATQTLRNRLRAIEGITDVRRLDFFNDTFSLLLVQMTQDVARAVNGMDINVVQWESMGGMKIHFKVMAIMVPQIRADYNGNCGIVHGT